MAVVDDDEETGHDVNGPPECANGSNRICLTVRLTNLLSEGLCPYSPPFLHSVSITVICNFMILFSRNVIMKIEIADQQQIVLE